jgi:cystathionine beta-lyase
MPAAMTGRRQGSDPTTLARHFGREADLVPLWIAEPSIDVAPNIRRSVESRAAKGWFGYETRPAEFIDSFWAWMSARHSWAGTDLHTVVSPSVGTSIGVLIDQLTDPGDGVIIQPPVFTDFKRIIIDNDRSVVRNPLVRDEERYRVDLDALADVASNPANKMLILCSPHNPVGRVWTREELAEVAAICGEHDVFVLADEIHADVTLPPRRFVPFADVAAEIEVRWAATHGPIKTFGLAGVCDTLLITDADDVADRFRSTSSRFHLTRNNVFALAAFEAAYREGADWLDDFLALITDNVETLQQGLPDEIRLVGPEGTYLAWLDLTALDLDVTEIPTWLASSAGLALSPGHWFGREGAGFARMTIGAPTDVVERAAEQLTSAVGLV